MHDLVNAEDGFAKCNGLALAAREIDHIADQSVQALAVNVDVGEVVAVTLANRPIDLLEDEIGEAQHRI